MIKAAFLFCTVLLVVGAYLILVKNFSGSKPAFYAKVITKKTETLLENDTVNWADFDIKRKAQRSDYSQTCQLVKANKKSLASKEASEIGQEFERTLVRHPLEFRGTYRPTKEGRNRLRLFRFNYFAAYRGECEPLSPCAANTRK
jgi:hypothetical protein